MVGSGITLQPRDPKGRGVLPYEIVGGARRTF